MSSMVRIDATQGGTAGESLTPASRRKTVVWSIGLVLALAGAVVMFLFDPARVPIYPVCVFHQMTGLDCPGCGSLRAAHQLLHGHLSTALHFNALFVLSLPLLPWVAFRFARRTIGSQPGTPVMRVKWIWWYVAAWIVFGILRDLPLPLFSAFAP
jgi:hypothetical protein